MKELAVKYRAFVVPIHIDTVSRRNVQQVGYQGHWCVLWMRRDVKGIFICDSWLLLWETNLGLQSKASASICDDHVELKHETMGL